MTVGSIPKDAYVMIIGAMKCGTSSLYSYMIEHPQICPCVIKEPEFFSENQIHGYDEKGRKIKECVTRYDDLWDFDPARHRYALEASTGYTKYPDEAHVPQTIHDAGIVPRFIYLVRNPFDRIESQYSFEKALPGFHRAASLASDLFLNYSNYFLQLTQYRRYFASANFLILDFDEMKQSPEATLRRVYAFLGMDAHIPASFAVFNETKLVSDLEVAVLHNRRVMAVAGLLPKSVRTFGRKWLRDFSLKTKKRRLTQTERSQIFERLQGDMRRFHEEYGVDVSRWGFHV